MNLPTLPHRTTLLFLLFASAALLATTVATTGLVGETLAQNEINTLLIVAERARDHIQTHIAPDSPDMIHDLFAQGVLYVDLLEYAVADGDVDSAERNFLYAMQVFKEISVQMHEDELYHAQITQGNDTTTPPLENRNTSAVDSNIIHPVNTLLRLAVYVDTLKTVSESIDARANFTHVDALFTKAWHFVDDGEIDTVLVIISEIKEKIVEIDTVLRLHGSEQMLQHAKEYATIHLERVDIILAQAEALEIPADVVADLVNARSDLVEADTPQDILDAIKRIMEILER